MLQSPNSILLESHSFKYHFKKNESLKTLKNIISKYKFISIYLFKFTVPSCLLFSF